MKRTLFYALAGCGLFFATAASAHVTLETQEAPVGGSYKAVLRVPHGCGGAATTAIRVQVPEGVIAAKPQPKAGWQIQLVKGKYEKAYDYYGTELTEGVTEIDWTGGDLPDAYYDEFVFRGYLTPGLEAGTTLYFPVVQECGNEVRRWIEIPAAGKESDDYESPAPGLKLLPAHGDDD